MGIPNKISPIGTTEVLPVGYTRIAYLENASVIQSGAFGACLIDTGLHVSNDTRVEVTGTPLATYWMDCFCNGGPSGIFYNPNQTPPRFGYIYGNATYYTSVYTSLGQKYNIVADGRDFYIDGKKLESFSSFDGKWNNHDEIPEAEPFETTTYYLFMRAPSYGCGKARIYDFNVRNGDIQQADYVPAVDPAGRPCFYDLVSKTPKYALDNSSLLAGIETQYQLDTLLNNLPNKTGSTKEQITLHIDPSMYSYGNTTKITRTGSEKNWDIKFEYV